jgi:hypothetical protein
MRALRRIQNTVRRRVYTAFIQARAAPHDYGLTLDDLERMTGCKPHSISGQRTFIEKIGLIEKTGERRWNSSQTAKQAVYRIPEGGINQ